MRSCKLLTICFANWFTKGLLFFHLENLQILEIQSEKFDMDEQVF